MKLDNLKLRYIIPTGNESNGLPEFRFDMKRIAADESYKEFVCGESMFLENAYQELGADYIAEADRNREELEHDGITFPAGATDEEKTVASFCANFRKPGFSRLQGLVDAYFNTPPVDESCATETHAGYTW